MALGIPNLHTIDFQMKFLIFCSIIVVRGSTLAYFVTNVRINFSIWGTFLLLLRELDYKNTQVVAFSLLSLPRLR